MYLRTPKKYSRLAQRRDSRRVALGCGLRGLLFLLLLGLTPLLIWSFINYGDNLRQYQPAIEQGLNAVIGGGQSALSTAIASTPTPTPTPDPARRQQAETAWNRGSMEEAINFYGSLRDSFPNDVQIHYRYTLALFIQGREHDALDASYALINADPFSSNAWALHAMMLDWNERPQEAVSAALHAIELDEQNARAYAFLAEAYFSLEQYERAQALVDQALELDPDSFEAYRVSGLLAANVAFDPAAARTAYQTAYELAPWVVYPAFDLATLQLNTVGADLSGTIDMLNGILELNPNNSRALYLLGLTYYQNGDTQQAAGQFDTCVRVDEQDQSCNYWLGRIRLVLEDLDGAVQYTQRAVELGELFNTPNTRHYWWAANALISSGRCSESVRYLQEGYQLARETEADWIYEQYDGLYQECGVSNPYGAPALPTAEPTAESGV